MNSYITMFVHVSFQRLIFAQIAPNIAQCSLIVHTKYTCVCQNVKAVNVLRFWYKKETAKTHTARQPFGKLCSRVYVALHFAV